MGLNGKWSEPMTEADMGGGLTTHPWAKPHALAALFTVRRKTDRQCVIKLRYAR